MECKTGKDELPTGGRKHAKEAIKGEFREVDREGFVTAESGLDVDVLAVRRGEE